MNSAAAAELAKVTVATIRTWCRRGVVAARKVAGRWIIEAASLARRIEIGRTAPSITTVYTCGHTETKPSFDAESHTWTKRFDCPPCSSARSLANALAVREAKTAARTPPPPHARL